MLEVSESARRYLARMVAAQDMEGLGLRMGTINPGLPNAECDLQFCPPNAQGEEDVAVDCGDFTLYVAGESLDYLRDASIDYDEAPTGGELVIKAPNLRGDRPGEDAALADRLKWLLSAEINPQLAAHGGQVQLVNITDDNIAILNFGGGCQGCSMVDVTLKQGVEKTLVDELPDLAGVRDATDHAAGDNPYM